MTTLNTTNESGHKCEDTIDTSLNTSIGPDLSHNSGLIRIKCP